MENNKWNILGKIFGTRNDGNEITNGKQCSLCKSVNVPDARFCLACGSEFDVNYDSFDAFISYRRETGSELASLLKVQLENKYHKRIFLDIKELQQGRFDEALLKRIEETPNFILILSKSSLYRCNEKSDWLKREVMHALATRRNIITILNKDFEFPSEKEWALLPNEMRVLSSLNGIRYDHIHQDSDIRTAASYMKSDKEVPPVRLGPLPVEPGSKDKPVTQAGQDTPDKPVMQAGQDTPDKPVTQSGPPEPVTSTPEGGGEIKSRTPLPPEHSPKTESSYLPVTGVLVKDATGSETILTEFGVRQDSGRNLENSTRDDFTIAEGKGFRPIPWGQIESIEILNRDDTTVTLCDGTSFEHIKLQPSRLVGVNEMGFSFVFEFNNKLKICTLSDPDLQGEDELIHKIPILAKQAIPSATKWTLIIQPESNGVSVTARNFYYDELKSNQTFIMPGPHKFMAVGTFVKFSVSQNPGNNFTLGPFPVETARALSMALTRLNSLLVDKASKAGEGETPAGETPAGANPESLIVVKRGVHLAVETRDSKDRSVYIGSGAILSYREKGMGKIYPWYRFQGIDGKDYWFDEMGPIDSPDIRCFFKIAETGQVGYLTCLMGDRDAPWGNLEDFRLEDEMVGPVSVRFEHIISITSLNNVAKIEKSMGRASGTLQKLGNYSAGHHPQGPCIVTPDTVIPLVRSNRQGSMTVNKINDSNKRQLIPLSIYRSRSQLKFILRSNSDLGHFDDTIKDIYILLNEQSLGWISIYIPSVIRIKVDPDCREAPVSVETSEGRTYTGVCPDPFNLGGSVFSFENAKKPMLLEAAERKS